MAPPKFSTKRGVVNGSSVNSLVKFSLRAVPLPKSLLDFILQNVSILKRLQQERESRENDSIAPVTDDVDFEDGDRMDTYGEIARKPTVKTDQFWSTLEEQCKKQGGEWVDIVDKIWAFGPQQAGGCILVDARKDSVPNS
jgi:ribosome assembly protein 1